MSACKCTVVLTFSSLLRLQVREVFTPQGCSWRCVRRFPPHSFPFGRIQHSLTSDCCCAQDFRNQRLPAPALSLLVHCLSALCLTAFICIHAALSCPCLSPRRSSPSILAGWTRSTELESASLRASSYAEVRMFLLAGCMASSSWPS